MKVFLNEVIVPLESRAEQEINMSKVGVIVSHFRRNVVTGLTLQLSQKSNVLVIPLLK